MKRILMIALIALLTSAVLAAAQEPAPAATPESAPIDASAQTIPTPAATPVGLSLAQTEALPVLIAVRTDLELLANEVYGLERPEGWSGSIDVTDPQLAVYVRLDLETLAGQVFGVDNRPADWFGVVASAPLAVARDMRHDLELIADQVIGAPGVRPAGWAGGDPLMRCSRATQALVALLQPIDSAELVMDFTQPDACRALEISASRYVETHIVQPSSLGAEAAAADPSRTSGFMLPFEVDTPFVVAFYDRRARRRAGVIPLGTGYRPIARSTASGSNMMLIRGDDFEVFVDYTTTSMSRDMFLSLPTLEVEGGSTFCEAAWCE